MKFINSAARAFDGLCDTVNAVASSAQLLTNKVNKELKIQQETTELEINAEVFSHKVALAKDVDANIEKLNALRSKDINNFNNIMNVLKGKPITWENSQTSNKSEGEVSTEDLF